VTTDLKPCPFCGHSDHDQFDENVPHCGRLCWVQCGWCKGAGPHRKKPRDAIEAWNRRLTPEEAARELNAAVDELAERKR
jgi:Lar family restriction alleviation protein